jgi:hypothetical protein
MANGRKVVRFAEQRFADAPLLRTLGEMRVIARDFLKDLRSPSDNGG